MKIRLAMAALALLTAACGARPEHRPDAQSAPFDYTAYTVVTVAVPAPRAPAAPGAAALPQDQRQWSAYRNYSFNPSSAMVAAADERISAGIAAYSRVNPSARFRLDSTRDGPDGDLGRRRIEAVRNSLIDAGVPPERIETGPSGNRQVHGDRLVQVQVSD